MTRFFKPFKHSEELVRESKADGILIDTFNKLIGKPLLAYCTVDDIGAFVESMHKHGREAWIAGSIGLKDLPALWETGVDVICVRGAACEQEATKGRFGEVTTARVKDLVATIP